MKKLAKLVVATVLSLPFAVGTALSAQAEATRFMLRNNSGYTLSRFYASPTYLSRWEDDILGSQVLYSGYEVGIKINDGRTTCWYDFKSVFSNGENIVRQRINVCKLELYTIE